MKKTNADISGIVLLAKQPGKTSFSSLSSVKRALGTTKVGHTGTLDSFASGLLVVLVGKLTHLVPHITNFDKTYEALIEFGSETDTLDPTGQVIKTGKLPTKEEIESVLPNFLGETDQIPPAYSALHVDGKRASDLMREGKSVELKPRKITISSIKLLDFNEKYARIEVSCSKGTYIRSLARDIASKCGTVAHLKELLRTRVGPFFLKDAVGSDSQLLSDDKMEAEIRNSLLDMTPEVASLCGMDTAVLASRYISDFNNGRPLKNKMFISDLNSENSGSEIAVFYPDGKFGGVITKKQDKNRFLLNYGFVIHTEQKMKIYSWEQISTGRFNSDFKEKGIALTIGSFDGSHLGHQSLFRAVISQKEEGLVPGVLTFTRSLRGYKNPTEYEGDIVSLSQKLDNLALYGFEFAVVVDFSSEFGRIEGHDFLSSLVRNCNLKYLAEGVDFHCGYKGLLGMEEIKKIALELNFTVDTIDSVFFEGERVSSSRLRKCVLEKNFSLVQKMLLKPFELDCTGFHWRKEDDKIIFASKKGRQLLPPNGTYRTMVSFFNLKRASSECLMTGLDETYKSGEAQKTMASADCTLENGILRLAFSDNLISGYVRSIKFF
ncbi:tRNA pseudouridine(55) synthase TruB [uncultured Treponema sp.]|uniref:tRNA pseudouridine(55) synthase TruB n=1 Tax=uncultured Treponema sp. TaxID=162155 RepID=UPI0025E03AC0|nr:tRNA pseudouridine(55) synthase TruB [uncultured Treponema sp.]